MTAPDAATYAKELTTLQMQMLTLLHKSTGGGKPAGPPGAAPGGAPPGAGGPPGGPPPGSAAGGPGGTNLAALQGGGGGPTPAAPSRMSPDMMRQLAAVSADQGGGDTGET
jgi:hypothetical protein